MTTVGMVNSKEHALGQATSLSIIFILVLVTHVSAQAGEKQFDAKCLSKQEARPFHPSVNFSSKQRTDTKVDEKLLFPVVQGGFFVAVGVSGQLRCFLQLVLATEVFKPASVKPSCRYSEDLRA